MVFVHDDPEFDRILRIVAGDSGLAIGLVEKDYWVTHVLWAIHAQRFDVWLKGGTSLSKGFALIERFSEDLDLKIEPGAEEDLPVISNWKNTKKAATAKRRDYFERLAKAIDIPGATIAIDAQGSDDRWRSVNLRSTYPSQHLEDLGPLSPFVLLEIGNARVTPYVDREMTSFIHEYLDRTGRLDEFEPNRPRAVRCVHPLVTLLEKLDAIHGRIQKDTAEPATFVRHYEDAARIIAAESVLPPLPDGFSGASALAREMLDQGDIRQLPTSTDLGFNPTGAERWVAIRRAYDAITPMYWGPRLSLNEACEAIRAWSLRNFNS